MLGTTVRLLALAIPVVTSVASAAALSRLMPRPSALLPHVGWWAIIVAASTTALVAVDRAARRLLPLVALLRLSMVFPDRAPSRFGIAFRAGTTRNLKEQLADARQRGIDDEPARSAERILTLVAALNRHDRATHGHSERVRALNDLIAEELRLPQPDRDRLRWAALLHDVGKVEVPAGVLNKPSVPSPDEWQALRRHPEAGARIAAPLRTWLGPWSLAIEEHHERWDGAGYPRGLRGQEISLAGRIVAVADVLDVLTTHRPYRRPVSAEAARTELARHAGSQFDPEVVRALLNVSLGKLRAAMGPVSWLAQLPFLSGVPRLEGAVAAAGRSAMTAAGTATGVGALAVMGMMGPSSPGRSSSPTDASGRNAGPSTVVPSTGGPSSGVSSSGNANAPGSGPHGDAGRTRPSVQATAALSDDKPDGGRSAARRPTPSASQPGGGDGQDPAPPSPPLGSQNRVSVHVNVGDGLAPDTTLAKDAMVGLRVGDQSVSTGTGSSQSSG